MVAARSNNNNIIEKKNILIFIFTFVYAFLEYFLSCVPSKKIPIYLFCCYIIIIIRKLVDDRFRSM